MAKIISALALLAVLAAASSSCTSQKTNDDASENVSIEYQADTTVAVDSLSLDDTIAMDM